MLLSVVGWGCLPYSMNSTAATVHRDSVTVMATLPIGARARYSGDEYAPRGPGVDVEGRIGMSDRSDLGLRITSVSGLVLSYKYRLLGDRDGAALAAQAEIGGVNLFSSAIGGVTVMASGSESRVIVPYAGARVLALSSRRSYVSESGPFAGGFGGLRIQAGWLSFFPEVAVYRNHAAPVETADRWLIIPSVGVRATRRNPPANPCRVGRWPRC